MRNHEKRKLQKARNAKVPDMSYFESSVRTRGPHYRHKKIM